MKQENEMSTLTMAQPVLPPALDGRWATLMGPQLHLWWQRARQRRQLAELSEGQLDDIGVTREQALAEAAKPFWKP